MTLPTCFCHLWISPPAKSLRIGLLNSNLISCHRDIYCVAYMGASKSYQIFRFLLTLNEGVISSLYGARNHAAQAVSLVGKQPIAFKKSTISICLVWAMFIITFVFLFGFNKVYLIYTPTLN